METEITALQHLPSDFTVPPGKLVVQQNTDSAIQVQINGRGVTAIDHNSYFFVAGLYGGRTKVLHGQLPAQSTAVDGFLRFPKRRFFRSYIQVTSEPLDSGNTLRIPAHVRDRLKSADDRKKWLDRNQLITALHSNLPTEGFSCWKRPLNSKVTSDFARPRTLPSGRSYYHSGVDLRAQTHTPIQAANGGTVVFAGHMLVPGNNVIISHGHGLFSRYMHMESVSKKVGERVATGEVIGTAGATGRVEAPHLHWEVIWKGQHADPLMFLKDWEQVCSGGSDSQQASI